VRVKTIVQLNEDFFEVDTEAFIKLEQNAYFIYEGEVHKDFVKITEWIEQHGRILTKEEVASLGNGVK
jgi:hypothetical protein